MSTPSASTSGNAAFSGPPTRRPPPSVRAFLIAVVVAAVGSVIAVALVTLIAQAVHVPAFHVFQPSAYIPLVIVGVIAGAGGWLTCVRRAESPGMILRWLVPTVLVVSFVPDVLLGMGLLGGESGMTVGGTITLMIMHLAVAAVALPTFARLMPLGHDDVINRRPIR